MNPWTINDRDDWLSWGRTIRAGHKIIKPWFQDAVPDILTYTRDLHRSALPVGLARSYGDCGLNPDGCLIDMGGMDRYIAFDSETGILRAEAGLSFDAILRMVVPRGFFVPTTPGTRFVTLGGAVANDVHGKNHHSAGTFGAHIRRLGLVRSDRGYIEIGPDENRPLFEATVGGLGLTGIVVWVEFQLARIPSARIDQELLPFKNIDSFFEINEMSVNQFEHTVAWIDGAASGADLGRGIYQRGNWSAQGGRQMHRPSVFSIPCDAPRILLGNMTSAAFNKLYYTRKSRVRGVSTVPYAGFFYPLDTVNRWNRLYGRAGFFQYQCVFPPEDGSAVIRAMLETIAGSGETPPLVVVKTFANKPSPGLLSFPAPGTTIAVDFQNRGGSTQELMNRLDDIVRSACGRLYPAKDGRMSKSMFRAGYPNWERFTTFVDRQLSSGFWRRVNA